jgi:magnesium-transporting ATPase (P-type)
VHFKLRILKFLIVKVTDRAEHMAAVVKRLESDLQLLCLTGVEDRLQV